MTSLVHIGELMQEQSELWELLSAPWLQDGAFGLLDEKFVAYPVGTIRRWVKGYVQKQADGKWKPVSHDEPGVDKAGHSDAVKNILAEIDKIFSIARVLPPPPPPKPPPLVIPPAPKPSTHVAGVKATDTPYGYDPAKEGQRKMLRAEVLNTRLDEKNGSVAQKMSREDYHKVMAEVQEEIDKKLGKVVKKPSSLDPTDEDSKIVEKAYNLPGGVSISALLMDGSSTWTEEEVKKGREAAQKAFGDDWRMKLGRAWQRRQYVPGRGFKFPEAMTDEEKEYENGLDKRAAAYVELAKELEARPVTPTPFQTTWTPGAKKAASGRTFGVTQEAEHFQRLCGPSFGPENAARKNPVKPLKFIKKGQRGYFSEGAGEINVGIGRTGVIMHEMGHHLEHQNGRIADASRHFLESRTDGEDAARMSVLSGNKSYGRDELAKKDKFYDPYVGKTYEAARSTECVAMGIEKFAGTGGNLSNQMQGFREQDPEHFALIYAIMHGKFGHRE